MIDYIITPDKREIPSGHLLSEELHRRALSIEMEVKGTNYKWESIHFYDPLSPETQCFVERNIHSHVYKIAVPPDSSNESIELQTNLIEIILHETGGRVFNPLTKESHDLKNFRNKSKESNSEFDFEDLSKFSSIKSNKPFPPFKEILWLVFSWALVFGGIYVYLYVSESRKTWILLVDILALVSAGGITFSITKSK